MVDFGIRQGDTAPTYRAILTDTIGTDWEIGDADVTFTLRHLATGVVVIDAQACVVESPTEHIVTYAWQPGDTDRAGLHIGEFRVTFSNDAEETFPDITYVLVQITPGAANVAFTSALPVSADDVHTLVKGGLTAAEAAWLTSWLLPTLVGDAEQVSRRKYTNAQRTETGLLLYPGQDFVRLHYLPVTDVASVSVQDVVWPVGTWALERNGVRLVGPSMGIPNPGAAVMTSKVNVTYTAGLMPEQVLPARLPIAMRAMRIVSKIREDQLGLDSLQVDQYRAAYQSEGFTEDEETTLRRLGSSIRTSALQNPTAWPVDAALEAWSDPVSS